MTVCAQWRIKVGFSDNICLEPLILWKKWQTKLWKIQKPNT